MSSRSEKVRTLRKVRIENFYTAAKMVPRYILGPPCFGEVPEISGNFNFCQFFVLIWCFTYDCSQNYFNRFDFATVECFKEKSFCKAVTCSLFLVEKGVQREYLSYKQVADGKYVFETPGCCADERYVVQKRPTACSC